jgi:DNA-binding phage protein
MNVDHESVLYFAFISTSFLYLSTYKIFVYLHMEKNIIYALKCPVTENIHYIGKSSNGMIRPLSHIKISHSEKIKQWVNDLSVFGYKPNIEIIEVVNHEEHLSVREKYWINKCLNDGCYLLNSTLVTPDIINPLLDKCISNVNDDFFAVISSSVKKKRKDTGLTQSQFAEKTLVALTVIRKIEQGKSNVMLSSLLYVLKFLNLKLTTEHVSRIK